MIAQLLLALALLSLASAPAPQDTVPATPMEPGVLLTFDDAHVDEWVQAIPLLAKYDARATFFVARFDRLDADQVAGLKQLEEAGHAIGCHGLRHVKAAEYAAEHGIDAYLAEEVAPALALMKAEGFAPTAFAYPSSNNDDVTDAALLKVFRHLRTGTAPKKGQRYAQMDVLYTQFDAIAGRGCLTGKGIDRIGQPGNEDLLAQLLEAMARAAERGEYLTLYAHNIAATSPSHHIRPATLEKILAHGQALGLRFYSFDELP